MDRQAIIDRLFDHYERPRNYGPLPPPAVPVRGGNPDCGDEVTIYLAVDEAGERVAALSFEGKGCTISQAAASLLSEHLPGMTLDEVAAFDDQALLDQLGREVVASRPRCATLALNTIKTAVARYRRGAPPRA